LTFEARKGYWYPARARHERSIPAIPARYLQILDEVAEAFGFPTREDYLVVLEAEGSRLLLRLSGLDEEGVAREAETQKE
jgi:hypothetical protein